MYCTGCGVENDDSARFCKSCGVELTAPETEGPPQSQAPSPTAEAAARGSSNVALTVAVVTVALLLLAVIGVGGFILGRGCCPLLNPPGAQVAAPADTDGDAADDADVEYDDFGADASRDTGSGTSTVSSVASVAEAAVVLENYLAADLGHDGETMARYLGGQAAARFRPEVQGQEDIIVYSKSISEHSVRNESTIDFTVAVMWSPEDQSDMLSDSEDYVLRRTEKGWLIFSTPAYPEDD